MHLIESLTQKERDALLINLTDRQKTFVNAYLKRGRRTVFANVLAKEKAGSVGESDMEAVASQWELQDYIDAGPDWQQRSKLYCECGRPLRYQYIVNNKETNEVRKFGIKHFQEHTGIPPHLVRDIVKGIEHIDFEADEILLKVSDGWKLEDEGINTIPPSIEIPKDIQQQFDYDVPLLDRQVRRLRKRIADYMHEEKRKEQEALREEKRKQDEALRAKQERAVQQQRETIAQRKQEIARKMGWDKKPEIGKNVLLGKDLQLGVFVYFDRLNTMQFCANDVCEHLIAYHGASNATYSSGKLQLFPDVCIFLESLVRQGKLELVEKMGVEDRIYRIIDPGLVGKEA